MRRQRGGRRRRLQQVQQRRPFREVLPRALEEARAGDFRPIAEHFVREDLATLFFSQKDVGDGVKEEVGQSLIVVEVLCRVRKLA